MDKIEPLPDSHFPPEADTDEKRFAVLAGRMFKADPAKFREQLADEAKVKEPGKPGRPRKAR